MMATTHPRGIRRLVMLLLAVGLVLGPWTGVGPPRAEAAGTTYYVDSAGGSDANSGTSAASAWKTLEKINMAVFHPGDQILLKAGSIWTNQYLDLKGSGSAGNPIVVDRYGTGAKPLINFGDTAVDGDGFGVRLRNVSYWEINNLEITSGQHASDLRRHGILIVGEGAGAGDFRHIYIRNNDIHDIFGTDRRTGGINFHARHTSSGGESAWDDILIENNTVINVADTGIQLMTDAFFTPSWTHKFNAFTQVVIRGNYVERIHRDGILVRASVSPLIEYNTTNDIGNACDVDTSIVSYLDIIEYVAAQWAYYTTGAVFQFNEAFNTRFLKGDGQPWDFDVEVRDSVYQYNFSHNNEGGTLLVMGNTGGNVFRYNISQDDLDRNGAFKLQDNGGTLEVYNNVIYRTRGQNQNLADDSTTGMATYRNNIFYNAASGKYVNSGTIRYEHNNFYGANANVPNDPEKVIGDPLFEGGGTFGTATASVYALTEGSPAIDTGKVIASNGGRDFAGNSLYNGAPDIGAHEYQGEEGPQSSPEPSVLFADDFEDGDAAGWTAVGGIWSVQADGSGKVYMQTSTTGEAFAYAGDASWTDYTLEADVKLMKAGGNAGLLLRMADADNYYMFRLNDDGDKQELYKKTGGGLQLLASAPLVVNIGQNYKLKASVSGTAITLYVNDISAIQWTAEEGEPGAGMIGMRVHSTKASVDNVKVTP